MRHSNLYIVRKTKGAVKPHTLVDLRGNIPTFIHVSGGKMHDVNVLDHLIPKAGAFYNYASNHFMEQRRMR